MESTEKMTDENSKKPESVEIETSGNTAMSESSSHVVQPSLTSQSDTPSEGLEDSHQMEVITEGVSKITPAEVLPWGPDPEEVILLFQELKQKQFLSFSWVCPGRRNPNEEEMLEPEPEIAADDSKDAQAGADDFDFEEEATPTMRRPVKGITSALKGSAKRKQPTSLAGILSNMERHRIMMAKDDSRPTS